MKILRYAKKMMESIIKTADYEAAKMVRLAFYCLLSTAICSLLYFAKIQPIDINQLQDTGDELRQISLNFFVQCKFNDCRSIAIPFLGYLLNLNTSLISYINLNTYISLLSLWGFILFVWRSFSTLAATLISAWVSFGLYLILPPNNGLDPTAAFAPCFLASLILIYKKDHRAKIFVILSYCINFNVALINYTFILAFIFMIYSTRFYQRAIIDILKASFYGLIIIHTYLLMIHTSLFEINVNGFNILWDAKWIKAIQGPLLYLTIFSSGLIYIFLLNKYRIHAATFALLTILMVLLNVFLYDAYIPINTSYLILCAYLLFDAYYSKTEPALL